MPKLRLQAEFGCWPLWDGSGDNIDPAHLPLPAGLVDRLQAWERLFDSTLDQNYPPDSGFPDQDQADAFDAMGRALASELGAALGSQWEVEFRPLTAGYVRRA